MKLLGLVLGAFAALGIALMSVHFWGLSQQYIPYENRFFSGATPWIIVPWEQSSFIEKKSDLILYAYVYKNSNQELLVAPSSEKNLKNRNREQMSLPARPFLIDLLKKFPQQRFVLNIGDNEEGIQELLAKVLVPEERSERILIQSDYNNVITATKDLLPRMVFGSTPADTMRLKSFQGMGILTATPFKGDVFFSAPKVSHREALNKEISDELHRRYKKVILGPLIDAQEAELALRLGSDGLFVEKPEWLLQWMTEWLRDKK